MHNIKAMKTIFSLLLASLFVFGCNPTDTSKEQLSESKLKANVSPDWAKNSNIYEVNIRQFTEEGTFSAFLSHLPRLHKMGIDILWLMPIHPISETKRKGSLGSYYAVSDFRAINPNYGTHKDFKVLVDSIHSLGMHVIIDWVPHHTGWDHPWIAEHPEYYSQDSLGNIIDPINEETGESWGWDDVAELKIDNDEMRLAIIDDMKFWLTDYNIDGFRVDHAHGMPDEYWNQVLVSLGDLDQDIFMLAEAEKESLRNDSNFVTSYAWHFCHTLNSIAEGKTSVNKLDSILIEDREKFNFGYQTYFTSNHDINSWEGTEFERFGEGHKTFAVLTSTIDGMPLLYTGQEEPIRRRLEFFEKDPIEWKDYAYADFYKTLLNLKKDNRALWNGDHGGQAVRINESDKVYAFKREKNGDKVVVIVNLSEEPQKTVLTEDTGKLTEVFSKRDISYSKEQVIDLTAWQYIVLAN
jgi:glycosidase